jgi:nucleoside-diphosphate-sugar epimerase
MSVIITGSDGFIGKKLVSKLKKKSKIKIICIGKNYGNLENKKIWEKLPKAKFLIHLANRTYSKKTWGTPSKYIERSLKLNMHAVEYCKKHSAKLIFPSSVVYGDIKKKKLSEKLTPSPANPYTLSKFLTENLFYFYSKMFNLKIIILRIFNVYGFGQKKSFLIPKLFLSLQKKVFLNSISYKRDFVYIDDVIYAFLKAMSVKKNFSIINVGGGKSYSIKQLIKKIFKITKQQLNIHYQNKVLPGEPLSVCADILKAKRVLNWSPKVKMDEGLKKYFKSIA